MGKGPQLVTALLVFLAAALGSHLTKDDTCHVEYSEID